MLRFTKVFGQVWMAGFQKCVVQGERTGFPLVKGVGQMDDSSRPLSRKGVGATGSPTRCRSIAACLAIRESQTCNNPRPSAWSRARSASAQAWPESEGDSIAAEVTRMVAAAAAVASFQGGCD